MTIEWYKLKSGTDIRGTAMKVENRVLNLTEEVAEIIGSSFITWLSKYREQCPENLSVSVGIDSRLSGDKLKKNIINGITALGVDVYDCGMASTPAMFMSTTLANYNYDAAIMITASHMPYYNNGFKFFTPDGGLEEEEIEQILEIAENANFLSLDNDKQGNVVSVDLISDYSKYIVNIIRDGVNQNVDKAKPLSGLNIIVDAGNGAGGFFVDKILKPLGADTRGSQFLDPDGHFPNHMPNPENKEAMEAIKKAVVSNNADLGIIFDTDVDRAAVVSGNGMAINRNKLIALISAIVLEEYPGSIIVTDSVTSKGLTVFIEKELGGYHHRFKRGYKNVINEALRLNNEGKEARLAIETSGHAAFKGNYFLDDGAYLIAKILIKVADMNVGESGSIEDLIATLKESEIKKEYRMKIKQEEFKEYGRQVLAELKDYVNQSSEWELAPKSYEGVRVNCKGNDWFLLRMSLHDPVLVLNIESESKGNLQTIKSELSHFLDGYEYIE